MLKFIFCCLLVRRLMLYWQVENQRKEDKYRIMSNIKNIIDFFFIIMRVSE